MVWEGLGRDGFRKSIETFDPEGISVLLFWIRGDRNTQVHILPSLPVLFSQVVVGVVVL